MSPLDVKKRQATATPSRPSTPSTRASAACARRLFLTSAWVSPPDETRSFAKDAPASVWESAASIAQRVGQEPLFLEFVARHIPNAPLRPEARSDLESQSRFHAFRWEQICESVHILLERFERKGIRPILLKGISQAGESYDPPRLRPMRDVDLLVRSTEIEEARRTANEAGFLPDPVRHPEERYARHHHLPPLFHGESGICLELHRKALNLPESFDSFPAVESFWSTTRESRIFPGRAFVLEPSLDVLTTCAHITHGDSIGRRAQNLIDLARTIEIHRERIDWDALLALASGADAARALAVPLSYLVREGLSSAPPKVIAHLRQRSRLREWEMQHLWALIDRYRIGAPPAWPLVSGRVSNILWRQALRRGNTVRRALTAARELLTGRFGKK